MALTEQDLSGRPRAPGPLALVQAFVNTCDVEGGTEVLSSPGALDVWLASAGLAEPAGGLRDGSKPPSGPWRETPSATEEDLRLAVDVREALRSLLAVHTGAPSDPAPAAALRDAASRGGLSLDVTEDGRTRWRATDTTTAASLALLVGVVHDAQRDGSWNRLKACRRRQCRCVFFDRSRNGTSVWCDMSVCGARAKSAAYYRRHRDA
jgi:predicted RNA-binding Zn ribbon-like protein